MEIHVLLVMIIQRFIPKFQDGFFFVFFWCEISKYLLNSFEIITTIASVITFCMLFWLAWRDIRGNSKPKLCLAFECCP